MLSLAFNTPGPNLKFLFPVDHPGDTYCWLYLIILKYICCHAGKYPFLRFDLDSIEELK
jgi:hypothetical protein